MTSWVLATQPHLADSTQRKLATPAADQDYTSRGQTTGAAVKIVGGAAARF